MGGFFARLAAYAIDCFLVWVSLLFVRLFLWIIFHNFPGNILTNGILFQYSLKDIIFYIVHVSYFVILTYFTGTTVGKRLLYLRVTGAGAERLSLLDVIYRETIGRFLCAVSFGIGYIMVGLDREKRGIHDLLCDTRVVYEKRIRVNVEYRMPMPQQMNQNIE